MLAIGKLLARFHRSHDSLPILVNSIKGHLGHCLGAAGGVETAYSVLSANHGLVAGNRNLVIPPTPAQMAALDGEDQTHNSEAIDRLFAQTSLPTVARCEMPPSREGCRRRVVLTNSFGFGGTNGSLLISNWVE